MRSMTAICGGALIAMSCADLGSNDGNLVSLDSAALAGDDATGATDGSDGSDGGDGTSAGDGSDGTDGSDSGLPPGTPTWHGAVRGILAQHCTGCHVAGGPAPFDASDYTAVLPWAKSVVLDLEANVMPPFLADTTSCRHYSGENVVSDDDKATVAAWEAAGMPEGKPTDYVAPVQDPPEELGAPDLSLKTASPYTPTDPSGDDLRCIPVGTVFGEDTDIERLVVVPDKGPIVHHVIVYEVSASAADTLDAMDAAEPGTGYHCASGPGVPARNIGGWVPGGGLGLMPKDTAVRIAKGSRLVLQMHYNTLFAPAQPDATTLQLWRAKSTPKWLLDIQGNANVGIVIPAGESNSVQQKTFPTLKEKRVVGVLAHMHKLGTSMKVTVPNADACVVDIPRWDFDWQQTYLFRPNEPLILAPGQSVEMVCGYDNSAANQPVIDGVQPAPIEVRWGEGTRDEMCLHYLMVQVPYTPPESPGTGECPGFEGCFKDCVSAGAGASRCVVQCSGDKTCRDCLIPGILGCLSTAGCANEVKAVQTCTSGIPLTKAVSQCKEQLLALDACGAPKVGACNGTCGIALDGLE